VWWSPQRYAATNKVASAPPTGTWPGQTGHGNHAKKYVDIFYTP